MPQRTGKFARLARHTILRNKPNERIYASITAFAALKLLFVPIKAVHAFHLIEERTKV
jgi:hypothetical protein